MKFEEMQVIWDSQREQTMYAIDREALHGIVRRRSRELGCQTRWDELGMLAVCLFLAVHLTLEPLLDGANRYQYFGAALFAAVAASIWRTRRRRLELERNFDATLAGDLSRAIFRVESRIRMARSFAWWFLAPAAVLVLLSLLYSEEPKPVRNWLIVLGSFPLSVVVVDWGLRRRLQPIATELHSLRDTLASDA